MTRSIWILEYKMVKKKSYHEKRSKQVEKKSLAGQPYAESSIFVKNAWQFLRFKESIAKKGTWNQAIYTFIYCQNRREKLSQWHEELNTISRSIRLSLSFPVNVCKINMSAQFFFCLYISFVARIYIKILCIFN